MAKSIYKKRIKTKQKSNGSRNKFFLGKNNGDVKLFHKASVFGIFRDEG